MNLKWMGVMVVASMLLGCGVEGETEEPVVEASEPQPPADGEFSTNETLTDAVAASMGAAVGPTYLGSCSSNGSTIWGPVVGCCSGGNFFLGYKDKRYLYKCVYGTWTWTSQYGCNVFSDRTCG